MARIFGETNINNHISHFSNPSFANSERNRMPGNSSKKQV